MHRSLSVLLVTTTFSGVVWCLSRFFEQNSLCDFFWKYYLIRIRIRFNGISLTIGRAAAFSNVRCSVGDFLSAQLSI